MSHALASSVREVLELEEEATPRRRELVRILYVERPESQRRAFLGEARVKMRDILFAEVDAVVKVLDMGSVPFRKQFVATQWADVFLSVHGAEMTLAALFLRPGSITVELFPWKFFWPGYSLSTASVGAVGLGYILDEQESRRTEEEKWTSLDLQGCTILGMEGDCAPIHRDVYLTMTPQDEVIIRKLVKVSVHLKTTAVLEEPQVISSLDILCKDAEGGCFTCKDRDAYPQGLQVTFAYILNNDTQALQFCSLGYR